MFYISVTINVNEAGNDLPVATNDSKSTDEDVPVNITVLSNDSDADGGTLTVTSVNNPTNGAVTDNGDGTFTYTPDPNFNGQDTFVYTVSDGSGGTATATGAYS